MTEIRFHTWVRKAGKLELRWLNHIAFWVFIILFFTGLPSLYLNVPFFTILLYNLVYIPFDLIAVYITLYILVPRFLIKGKPLYFFLGIAGIAVINYFVVVLFFIRQYIDPVFPFQLAYKHWIGEFVDSFTMLLFIIGLATVLKFLRYYYSLRLEKVELEKTNLQSELKVLKSQITPHFLFNVLNNIDELIYQDRDKASAAIIRFSGLLRKLFGEISQDWIPLEDELNQVRDFVELMRLGLPSPGFISFTVNGDPTGMLIPPMILMPLVENTFKHAERRGPEPGIIIRVDIQPDSLHLFTENQIRTVVRKQVNSGTGLENLKKRLQYLYPGKYSLIIDQPEQLFRVDLKLNLT